jgi:hypothetical protein
LQLVKLTADSVLKVDFRKKQMSFVKMVLCILSFWCYYIWKIIAQNRIDTAAKLTNEELRELSSQEFHEKFLSHVTSANGSKVFAFSFEIFIRTFSCSLWLLFLLLLYIIKTETCNILMKSNPFDETIRRLSFLTDMTLVTLKQINFWLKYWQDIARALPRLSGLHYALWV